VPPHLSSSPPSVSHTCRTHFRSVFGRAVLFAETTDSLQYHGTAINERLALARFGQAEPEHNQESAEARAICVQHALQLAAITKAYRSNHGSARTFVGNSLSTITVGAVVLIASWTEGQDANAHEYIECVDSCVQSIQEMQSSTASARTMSRQVSHLMRRCGFPNLPSQAQISWNEDDEGLLSRLRQTLPGLTSQPRLPTFGEADLFPAMSEFDDFEISMPWSTAPCTMDAAFS
jgi:hypothetical protein